jgi:predicted permease
VSDHYFETLGIPIRRGRVFDSREQRGSTPVVVLSERAARDLFPDADALGQSVAMGISLTPESGPTAEIVGIVGDVLYDRPSAGVMAEVYVSHRQEDSYGTFLVRTRGDPLTTVPAIRAAIREIDADIPLVSVRTMAGIEAAATSDTRVIASLLLAFAVLSLVLACTGVWATVAFSVSRRTREFGLRLALGARPAQVVGTVVREGARMAVLGIGMGVALAWTTSRLLSSLLFGVAPTDPLAFGGGALVLAAVAVFAAWLPARRATRVDPVESLRAE